MTRTSRSLFAISAFVPAALMLTPALANAQNAADIPSTNIVNATAQTYVEEQPAAPARDSETAENRTLIASRKSFRDSLVIDDATSNDWHDNYKAALDVLEAQIQNCRTIRTGVEPLLLDPSADLQAVRSEVKTYNACLRGNQVRLAIFSDALATAPRPNTASGADSVAQREVGQTGVIERQPFLAHLQARYEKSRSEYLAERELGARLVELHRSWDRS